MRQQHLKHKIYYQIKNKECYKTVIRLWCDEKQIEKVKQLSSCSSVKKSQAPIATSNKKIDVYIVLGRSDLLEENKIPIAKLRGIYFLILGDEIVCVGQATDVISRVYHHAKKKDFDSFTCFECKNGDMNLIEAEYILQFNPAYNQQIPQNDKYVPFHVLRGILKVSKGRRLKRFIKRNQIKPVYSKFHKYYHVEDFKGFVGDQISIIEEINERNNYEL